MSTKFTGFYTSTEYTKQSFSNVVNVTQGADFGIFQTINNN